jgi:hypothetical protein
MPGLETQLSSAVVGTLLDSPFAADRRSKCWANPSIDQRPGFVRVTRSVEEEICEGGIISNSAEDGLLWISCPDCGGLQHDVSRMNDAHRNPGRPVFFAVDYTEHYEEST